MPGPRASFARLAATYDRLRPEGGGDKARAKLLLDGVAAGARTRLLEIGCGTGKLTLPVARLTKARIDAVDVEGAMLKVARRKDRAGRVHWRQASAIALPYLNRTFDLAFMSLVAHHLDDPVRAYTEIQRVLKPGGCLAIWTFTPAHFTRFFLNAFFPSIAAIDSARFPKSDALRRQLRAAGFRRVRSRPFVERTSVRLDALEERVRHRYITTLELVPPAEFARGIRRIAAARREAGPAAEIKNVLRWQLVRAWME
jgi:ubiquinone/menaquinone biosynthesis C-methylase UbiE